MYPHSRSLVGSRTYTSTLRCAWLTVAHHSVWKSGATYHTNAMPCRAQHTLTDVHDLQPRPLTQHYNVVISVDVIGPGATTHSYKLR